MFLRDRRGCGVGLRGLSLLGRRRRARGVLSLRLQSRSGGVDDLLLFKLKVYFESYLLSILVGLVVVFCNMNVEARL
jgi:hypothetical protein